MLTTSAGLRREISAIERSLRELRSTLRELWYAHQKVLEAHRKSFQSAQNVWTDDEEQEYPLPDRVVDLVAQIEKEQEELEYLEADLRMALQHEAEDAQEEEYEAYEEEHKAYRRVW